VVTRRQLLDAGIPSTTIEDRVSRGQLIPLHRGVYAVGHAHLRPNGYRRALDACDVTTVEGIPVTTVSRTLLDLAEVLAHQALTKVCSEAERQRTVDVKRIEEAIGRVRGRRGPATAKLRAALEELGLHGTTLTRSPLEDQFLSLLDAYDLPRPATNAYVVGYEFDAVWRLHHVAVELDG
jgi:hypothetical protein